MDQHALDCDLMRRCIRLGTAVTEHDDVPIGCVIAKDGEIIAEAGNAVRQNTDPTAHAELLAMKAARGVLNRSTLADCTLYTTVEPCPMCSFAIRQAQVGRVVFAIGSPIMGGLSKWNVLRDPGLADALPEVFGPVPEVTAGLLGSEAIDAWRQWNPLVWAAIEHRSIFSEGAESDAGKRIPAPPVKHPVLRSLGKLRDLI